MLEPVERIRVDADHVGLREQRVRAGREILQTRADSEHAVGVVRERVRDGRAGHAERARVQRIVPHERAFAGLRFRNRNAVRGGEGFQRIGRATVQHAAAGDNHRPLRAAQTFERGANFMLDRRRRMERHHARRKEVRGEIPRRRLHVLRQRERDRAAKRRVGQHAQRARQCVQQLRRMHDAIEVARHRLEHVVRRDAAVLEVLDLLKHRIGRARNENVAGQQQHRQTVHMRERRRRDEIRRARADRRRDRHHPSAEMRLCVSDRAVRHRLLVLRAQRRQLVTMLIQRLAEARDVAVPEDREHAAEEQLGAAAVFRRDALRREVTHERLRGGQADGAACLHLDRFVRGRRIVMQHALVHAACS